MKVLITGKDSYIGRNIKVWLENTGKIFVDVLDLKNPDWINYDFTPYDTVIHVAAIVHKKNKIPWQTYYKVNTLLAYKVAKKARNSHVDQFIFFSSMAVYGQGKKLPKGNIIDERTPLNPKSYYGRSKLMAENKILRLNRNNFKVSVVRPPNVYGYGCPGNYIYSFVKLVKLTPVIPVIYTDCRQGFIYIDNLCKFIYLLIKDRRPGVFHPQDKETISTFMLLSEIANLINKKVRFSKKLGEFISYFHKFRIIRKIFGAVSYSTELANKPYNNYSKVDFKDALKKTIINPKNNIIKDVG